MTGYYYDEFEVGRVFKHAIRRTVTETDNVLLEEKESLIESVSQ